MELIVSFGHSATHQPKTYSFKLSRETSFRDFYTCMCFRYFSDINKPNLSTFEFWAKEPTPYSLYNIFSVKVNGRRIQLSDFDTPIYSLMENNDVVRFDTHASPIPHLTREELTKIKNICVAHHILPDVPA